MRYLKIKLYIFFIILFSSSIFSNNYFIKDQSASFIINDFSLKHSEKGIKKWSLKAKNGIVYNITNNVELTQGEIILYNYKNNIMADTISISFNNGLLNKENSNFILENNVIIIYYKKKIKCLTEKLNYNNNILSNNIKNKILFNDYTITGNNLFYNNSTSIFSLKNNIKIINPFINLTLFSDNLIYKKHDNLIFLKNIFKGIYKNILFKTNNLKLTLNNNKFNSIILNDNVEITRNNYIIKTDELLYSKDKIYFLPKKFKLINKIKNYILYSNNAVYDFNKKTLKSDKKGILNLNSYYKITFNSIEYKQIKNNIKLFNGCKIKNSKNDVITTKKIFIQLKKNNNINFIKFPENTFFNSYDNTINYFTDNALLLFSKKNKPDTFWGYNNNKINLLIKNKKCIFTADKIKSNKFEKIIFYNSKINYNNFDLTCQKLNLNINNNKIKNIYSKNDDISIENDTYLVNSKNFNINFINNSNYNIKLWEKSNINNKINNSIINCKKINFKIINNKINDIFLIQQKNSLIKF